MSLFDVNGAPLGSEPDTTPKPTAASVKKITYEHQSVLNQMLATAGACPMDIRFKDIIKWRIWGEGDPNVIGSFNPLSYEQIVPLMRRVYEKKCTSRDIERWEEDALYNMDQFLGQRGIVEISEKFLRDNHVKDIMGKN